MRADSGLTPGLSDTDGVEDGELALDPEGRSGEVEQAARATSSAAKIRGQTRREGRCPATLRTLSAAWGFRWLFADQMSGRQPYRSRLKGVNVMELESSRVER